MQSINTIPKYHTCEKIYSFIAFCRRRRKNLCRKYYGGENMTKNKQKVKATCRLKFGCSKALDHGLLCCSLITDAIVIMTGKTKKLKRLID